MARQKKYISADEALKRIQRYCAYQDRCHQEVRYKLLDLGIYGQELEEIITALIEEKFLDEERFAKSFARGKFRIKKWGRQRILIELKKRDISDYCLRKAMEEIEEEEYITTLSDILAGKLKQYETKTKFEAITKAAQYAISRGYESSLVWEMLNKK